MTPKYNIPIEWTREHHNKLPNDEMFDVEFFLPLEGPNHNVASCPRMSKSKKVNKEITVSVAAMQRNTFRHVSRFVRYPGKGPICLGPNRFLKEGGRFPAQYCMFARIFSNNSLDLHVKCVRCSWRFLCNVGGFLFVRIKFQVFVSYVFFRGGFSTCRFSFKTNAGASENQSRHRSLEHIPRRPSNNIPKQMVQSHAN